MARLTKNEFKSVVKECLIEILHEGLHSSTASSMTGITESRKRETRSQKRKQQGNTVSSSRRTGLDSIKYGEKEARPVNESFERNINTITRSMTSDPVLSSILMDTAKTTLQEQNDTNANRAAANMSKDPMARKAAESDPTVLFEGADKWAQLAFAPSLTKR